MPRHPLIPPSAIALLTGGVLTGAILTAAVGAGAAPAPPPSWNSGYNGWWPSGFGYPPVTVQARGYPCSVTAYGPTFRSGARGWSQFYGGGVSCARGVGSKRLTVREQVLAPDGRTWVSITGSGATAGPVSANPLRAIRRRAAYLGHVYRTVASATLVVPNGHAGCSLTNTCSERLTVTAVSRRLAP